MDFQKILVPVIGNSADEDAIKLACRLAKKAKAKVYAVHVITLKPALPVDAEVEPEIQKGETILGSMEIAAEEEGYTVETELLQARDAGTAILDEAVDRDIDLILIGLPYKMPFGRFSMGQVGPYLLKNARCRVLMLRENPE